MELPRLSTKLNSTQRRRKESIQRLSDSFAKDYVASNYTIEENDRSLSVKNKNL